MNDENPLIKQCPKCKEEIKKDALACKHCGNKFDIGSEMISFGNKLTGCGCALIILVVIILLLIGLL